MGTGKITSVLVVGASVGEMLIPLTVANISFKWFSLVTFLYILLACSAGGFLTYAAIVLIGRPLLLAKQAKESLGKVFAESAKENGYGTFNEKVSLEVKNKTQDMP